MYWVVKKKKRTNSTVKEDRAAPVLCSEQPSPPSIPPQLRRERDQSPLASDCTRPGPCPPCLTRGHNRSAKPVSTTHLRSKKLSFHNLGYLVSTPTTSTQKRAQSCTAFFFSIIKSPLTGDDPLVHSQASEPGQGGQGLGRGALGQCAMLFLIPALSQPQK